MEYIEYKVKSKGMLQDYIEKEFATGRAKALKLICGKEVKVNGKRVSENMTVAQGDKVGVYLTQKDAERVIMPILYKDDNIVVIVKPSGIETCGEYSAEYRLSSQLGSNVYACHRLDYNTSGLNVFALNENALSELEQCFKERRVEKIYLAQVAGNVKNVDVIKGYLFKDAVKKIVYVTAEKKKGSVYAETRYRIIGHKDGLSILEIEIHSGRTHQIRAMLAYKGIYIVGDGKYGDYKINEKYGEKVQQLFCSQMVFSFPKDAILGYLDEKKFEYLPEKLKLYRELR